MRKIYLHVGLPKTGTSAIQTALYNHRDVLKENGVLYPAIMLKNNPPKHQKLVKAFDQVDFLELKIFLDKNKYETIILSTEGITNHFYDFPSQSFEKFKDAIGGYQLIIVYVVREKESWLRSYYTQAVFNPQSARTHYYGTSLLYRDFIELKRIRYLSNFDQLEKDITNKTKPKELILLNHSRNMLSDFSRALELPELVVGNKKINFSPPEWSVELMRQINSFTEEVDYRIFWKSVIKDITGTNHTIINKRKKRDMQLNGLTLAKQINNITPISNNVFNLDRLNIERIKLFVKKMTDI